MVLPSDTKFEQPNIAAYDVPDPEVHVGHIVLAVGGHIEHELARVDRGTSAEEQQMVHKLPELPNERQLLRGQRYLRGVGGSDAEARHVLPEVPPAPGEEGRPNGLLRLEEGEYVLQECVREVSQKVACHRRRLLRLLPRRHFVEQAAGVLLPPAQRGSRSRRRSPW